MLAFDEGSLQGEGYAFSILMEELLVLADSGEDSILVKIQGSDQSNILLQILAFSSNLTGRWSFVVFNPAFYSGKVRILVLLLD